MIETLEIHKPRGIEALRQNRIALNAIESQTDFRMIGLSDVEPSRIDGFVYDTNAGIIVGSYEIKSRLYDLQKLQTTYKNKWMIDWSKLQAALEVTKHTKLPFYGVLHLKPDNLVMMVEIFNSRATWACNVELLDQWNNGKTERMAYIHMDSAKVYKIRPSNDVIQTQLFP